MFFSGLKNLKSSHVLWRGKLVSFLSLFVAVLCMLGDYSYLSPFQILFCLCFFIHCAKTAVFYSRRPPGVLVFIFPLCLFNSISNHISRQICVWKCSHRFLWLIDLVVESSQSKQTKHIFKMAGRVKQTQSIISLRLSWADYEQHKTNSEITCVKKAIKTILPWPVETFPFHMNRVYSNCLLCLDHLARYKLYQQLRTHVLLVKGETTWYSTLGQHAVLRKLEAKINLMQTMVWPNTQIPFVFMRCKKTSIRVTFVHKLLLFANGQCKPTVLYVMCDNIFFWFRPGKLTGITIPVHRFTYSIVQAV